MALKPSQRRLRMTSEHDEELNLVPVMDIFLLLITFLLVSTVFVQIGTIDTSLPLIGNEDKDKVAELKQGIALTVTIVPHGFIIKGKLKDTPLAAPTINDSLKNYLSVKGELIPKGMNGQYDFEELSKALLSIKKQFPDEDTVFIIPESEILYDNIIKTMDAARLTTLISEDGMRKQTKLFENAVIATVTD